MQFYSIERSIQIDPAFAYYTDRSPESVASELLLAGYRNIRYFVTDETRVNGELVRALRRQGLSVWAMVLGNGAYNTGHLPPEWPRWQMTLLKRTDDGYTRLSPHSMSYTLWKKHSIARLLREHPFSGLEVAEPYLPEWNGLTSGVYGDVGPLAAAAFKQFCGSEMPDFVHRTSPRYYQKDRARHLMWIEFRVQAVNRFLNEIINGAGGARSVRPDIRIATWSLAVDAGRDPVGTLREVQGTDAAEMIRLIQPDLHILQTHWPDWMRGRLPADYVRRYRPFVRQIRASHPGVPLGVQTDIGSLRPMRRSRAWLESFASAAAQEGYRMWTAYEYSIGLPMYTERPAPLRARRADRRTVVVDFNKRIDEASAASPSCYDCRVQGQPVET
ncbi:N-acyl-D-glucosamine 2-epimerase, partial [Paenibacillus sp. KR2-11]|uniref:N-acyl-D-glucosamine 2-epimerase n=1 Tax=Paenibacillus sp. KR2-11 TaxID=3385500 RepID=UPI0038FD18D1